jgi:hypothetical protein
MDSSDSPAGRSAERTYKVEFSILTVAVVVLGLGYFAFGRFESRTSQSFLLIPIAVLFTSHIRYMGAVEGRPFRRMLFFTLALGASAWIVEAVGVASGLYGYESSILGSLPLGGVPIVIPCVWVLFCWLASSIVHYLWGRGAGRKKELPLLWECLASAWVLVTIALAIEWHFSGLIGLWNWGGSWNGPTIDGVPAVNFLIWFGVGFVSPLLQRLTRTSRIAYRTESTFLQSLPVQGYGFVLAFNAGLNLVRGFPLAAALCGASVLFLGASLSLRARRLGGAVRPPRPEPED